MLRSAVVAVLAVALSSSVAAAQTFAPEAETLFALAASLRQQAPIEKSDRAVTDYLAELTRAVAMEKADLREGSVFRSALSAVLAAARSSSAMFAPGPEPESTGEATTESPELAVSYSVEVRAKRTGSLMPLYAVQGAVHTLDLFSTWRMLDSGRGREANPIFKSGNHALMVGVKLGAMSANMFLLEKLRRKHPVTAVAILIATNVVVSGVVVNNLRIGS